MSKTSPARKATKASKAGKVAKPTKASKVAKGGKAAKAGDGQRELRESLASVTAQLGTAQKQLAKATERVERWKAEAKTHQKAASSAEARVARLQRKLDRAAAAAEPTPEPQPDAVETTSVDDSSPVDAPVVPDETWSVVRLRAEARSRGLVGLSNKPKAELIAALS